MLLSIVLMVKNEEKYLDKTLNALKPLRDNLNSELIILDTGSTDESINISKKYTDKVYHAKWNDNFSDMRNVSISYASGEWILILDADEELVEWDKLIEFFKNDLHKKFNTASVELKNIHSENKEKYTKSVILRMFKNKNFRYEGAIHEQPLYREPIYNNIAVFDHYGYLYTDEETKQKKLKRNEKILLSEFEYDPNNPYICFQLAKNFMAFGNNKEAIYYMEKSTQLYRKLKRIPAFVESNLAKLYLALDEFDKCENVCVKYVKNDDKNIDIYYYLALSQRMLNKYEQSLSNYKRYIFLLENYEISTQANSIYCDGNTVDLREQAEIDIVKILYSLEKYKEVVDRIIEMKIEQIQNIYLIVFRSLFELDRLEYILELYNNLNSKVEEKSFKLKLEEMILSIRESDRKKVYKILINIDDNYGLLNKIRTGKILTSIEYNEVIVKEKDVYYADIIYYAFNQGIEIEQVLKGASKIQTQNYFNHIIRNRRDCVIDIYKYLLTRLNTLDLEKINIYSLLSKSLLSQVDFSDDKYLNLFLMYIKYSYDYLREVYDKKITDKELIRLVNNEEEEFIIDIKMTQELKDKDKLKYIVKMKDILIYNQHHKKGIELLIKRFEYELNEVEELKKLKIKYKSIIENSVNLGDINEAEGMIKEYESMFNEDAEILNMKAIIDLLKNDLNNAEMNLRKALLLEYNNFNTIYNVAYLKEISGEIDEAIRFYNKIVINCDDKDLVLESREKIDLIKQRECCAQGEF